MGKLTRKYFWRAKRAGLKVVLCGLIVIIIITIIIIVVVVGSWWEEGCWGCRGILLAGDRDRIATRKINKYRYLLLLTNNY